MNYKFMNIDEKKRDILINAGFKEFSSHGRKRASLNNILKSSNYSKGVFYHYFKGKDDFYIFLLKFAGKYITKQLEEESLLKEDDFINRIILSFLIKSEIFKKYNDFARFLMLAYQENDVKEVQNIIQKESNNYEERFISENINFGYFKTEDNKSNIRVVGRYLHTVFNEILSMLDDMSYEDIKKHMFKEAKYLRKVLYKEENV